MAHAAAPVSCFFCQNLLSDHLEGILPQARHQELEEHLEDCASCTRLRKDLVSSLEILRQLPPPKATAERAARLVGAALAGQRGRFRRRASFAVLALSLPALALGAAVVAFPDTFPAVYRVLAPRDDSRFVRYYPLLQGAQEIVEEQSNWLHLNDAGARSVWEEGGLSPDEFEKAFQLKGAEANGPAPEGSGD